MILKRRTFRLQIYLIQENFGKKIALLSAELFTLFFQIHYTLLVLQIVAPREKKKKDTKSKFI